MVADASVPHVHEEDDAEDVQRAEDRVRNLDHPKETRRDAPMKTPTTFYAYVVVDITTTPPTPVVLEMTRRDAHAWIGAARAVLPRQSLRVRRAKVKLFDS
jgi:hypothetical protein